MNEEENTKLYIFLKELKNDNWIITDINKIYQLYEWFIKTTGYISAYENIPDPESQFCMMTYDLCNYFKQEIKPDVKLSCPKCRRLRTPDDFLGNKICRKCRKNK